MNTNAIKKIGVLTQKLGDGGLERVVSLLLPILQDAGFQPVLLTNQPKNPHDYPIPQGIARTILPQRGESRSAALIQAIRTQKIDILFHHTYFGEELEPDILTGKACGIPTILTHHNSFSALLCAGDSRFFKLLKTCRLADLVIALSHTDKTFFRMFGVRSEYIPNPLTFSVANGPARQYRKHAPVLLFPARLTEVKQPQEAIRIFKEVRNAIPDAILRFTGCGEKNFEKEIKRLTAELDLQKSVEFSGYSNDMEKVFADADLMLITSVYEGFPMTMLEAKAVGLPVVAYNLPYLETMKPETGVALVPSGDRIAAAMEIIRLLKESDHYRQYSIKARQDAMRFAQYNQVKKYQELFSSLEKNTAQDNSASEQDSLMLETLFQCIMQMGKNIYKEGAADKETEIVSGTTYRTGFLLTKLSIHLKKWLTRKK